MRLVVQRFLAHDMPIYAGALAFRDLLAVVPLALLIVSVLGLFGVQGSVPRPTGLLLRLGSAVDEPVPGDATLGRVHLRGCGRGDLVDERGSAAADGGAQANIMV
ncbi:MAG TPA: hypothetical protein VHG35_12565 [Gemmatimonadales bacterium]|nr:hypothetical protein [Gemmatimonadales bacterium]